MPRTRRASALIVVVVLALVATLAGPVAAAPPQVPNFGPAIDAYAKYDPQKTCLSQAQPGVVDFRALLQQTYNANGGGILRACGVGGVSEHKEGRAYDWMVDATKPTERAKADEFLAWLLATDQHGNQHAMARRFGVMYIIWNGRMWRAYRPNEGWSKYTGANPHTDHVHFSFSWDGALRRTTFWTGASTAIPRASFPDVPRSSYFAEPVDWLLHHDITTGWGKTGEFRPHNAVTRAQMAAFLWRMMDKPTGYPSHGFPDVPSSSYYEQPVRWLKATGITQGVGDSGRFEPHRVLTRGEMAEFLWRTGGRDASAPRHGFPDITSAQYYDQAVSWMVAHGITTGYGKTGRFEPNKPVTRAQNAAFMHRFASNKQAWRAAATVPSTVLFR